MVATLRWIGVRLLSTAPLHERAMVDYVHDLLGVRDVHDGRRFEDDEVRLVTGRHAKPAAQELAGVDGRRGQRLPRSEPRLAGAAGGSPTMRPASTSRLPRRISRRAGSTMWASERKRS